MEKLPKSTKKKNEVRAYGSRTTQTKKKVEIEDEKKTGIKFASQKTARIRNKTRSKELRVHKYDHLITQNERKRKQKNAKIV